MKPLKTYWQQSASALRKTPSAIWMSWKSFWRACDGHSIAFSILVWLLIEAELCYSHGQIQDYVGQFVDTRLLIAQFIAVMALFVGSLLFDRRERTQATAKAAPPAGGSVGAAPVVATSGSPPTLSQTEQILAFISSEIPKVPILFGAAAFTSSLSGAVAVAIAASKTGGWAHVFNQSLSLLLGSALLFAFATFVRSLSKAWFVVVTLLGAGFVFNQM